MKVSYSEDFDTIKKILTCPENWHYISDDFCESIQEYEPVKDSGIHYYLVTEIEKPAGVLMLVQASKVAFELHAALLPEYKGGKSALILKALINELYHDLPSAKRLRVFIPSWNKPALSAAIKTGLEFIGIEKNGSAKDGALHDLILFGVSV